MRHRVEQRRLLVDGNCGDWIARTVDALTAAGCVCIETDGAAVRALFHERRTHGSIVVKAQALGERCSLFIATVGARRGRRSPPQLFMANLLAAQAHSPGSDSAEPQ